MGGGDCMAFGQLANHGIGGFWELGIIGGCYHVFHIFIGVITTVFFEIGDEKKDIRS